ncbi:aldehyde dehydrogenase family protein [Conexibacter sp. DBS9H8]|uniref:aldehyde dehydrogenase family protein n=1 Tax=Conexibacter sp. DBS9H8 TaxID=2937801 RepID=UPI00200DA0D8|nr:aldehyde dehydrogenase family protein [Conexibacter sp. DBS9H8]
MPEFANEPLLELRRADERARCREALAALTPRLPLSVPVIVAGDRRHGADLVSPDPSHPARKVALACRASASDVDSAVSAATAAQRAWGAIPVGARAAILRAAAAELAARRYELAALEVAECAKPWPEAAADVAEAIDFCRYYAHRAEVEAAGPELLSPPGERNRQFRRPRGVCAVIAPWNFPIAIACGMTAAALVTGNAVCLKPAEQSPGCALAIFDAFAAAGLPPGVLNLLPGEGETGAALVVHPGVSTVAFTGSAAVGLEIMAAAARPAPGQRHLTRVVAELGGKNAMIVDADADLDDVVPAALTSAFGFAGQKCSATARLLVHERVAATLKVRLIGALATLAVGPAEAFGTDVPAVIEADAQARIAAVVAAAAGEAHSGGPLPDDDGYYVPPTLVFDPPAGSHVTCEEIFGPVLSVETVPSLAAACDRVDEQPQALTGAVFTRSPDTVAYVSARTPVGNLYVNRPSTGAIVGRQPFGGNRLSGTGSKAGGPDYLAHFSDPVVVCEDLTRHGIPA